MTNIIYPFGSKTLTVAASGKVAVTSFDTAEISQRAGYPNYPNSWSLVYQTAPGESYTTSAFSAATDVIIQAGAAPVYWETGPSPVVSIPPNVALPTTVQGAPTAKTVSATLTAAELQARIITVNQAAAGASAQQLPLATAMDTAFPDSTAGFAFDFSVINTSTVDAEDASLTTNTGWTLVGNMDIPAYSAAGSLNSSALFRARKTATGAWTLYRIG